MRRPVIGCDHSEYLQNKSISTSSVLRTIGNYPHPNTDSSKPPTMDERPRWLLLRSSSETTRRTCGSSSANDGSRFSSRAGIIRNPSSSSTSRTSSPLPPPLTPPLLLLPKTSSRLERTTLAPVSLDLLGDPSAGADERFRPEGNPGDAIPVVADLCIREGLDGDCCNGDRMADKDFSSDEQFKCD